MRIRWTTPALNDLKAISRRIEQERNFGAANRMCRSIYSAIQVLRRYPQSGRQGDEQEPRELVVPQSPYLVAYRVMEPDAIQILCIWSGAQDRQQDEAEGNAV